MIRLQIVETPNAGLYVALLGAMRSGELRTFVATKRGRRITHTNVNYPGWMNWSHSGGVITCEVLSPRKPGSEWRLLSAFVGRLADKYSDSVHSLNIQFPDERPPARSKPSRKRRRAKR